MADPYTLDFIWSKYTTSPHPEIGMDSLHQTCSSLIKHVLLPSHISLLHSGFVLHPELVEVIQNAVPALGQLLYIALPHIGVCGAHTFAHDELRFLGNLTGLLATQNQVILHWILLLDKIYGAMADLKATCFGYPVSTSQRPSHMGNFIASLPIDLRIKLPQALLARFDIAAKNRLAGSIRTTVSTPSIPLLPLAPPCVDQDVVDLEGQTRDIDIKIGDHKGYVSLYDRIQLLKKERQRPLAHTVRSCLQFLLCLHALLLCPPAPSSALADGTVELGGRKLYQQHINANAAKRLTKTMMETSSSLPSVPDLPPAPPRVVDRVAVELGGRIDPPSKIHQRLVRASSNEERTTGTSRHPSPATSPPVEYNSAAAQLTELVGQTAPSSSYTPPPLPSADDGDAESRLTQNLLSHQSPTPSVIDDDSVDDRGLISATDGDTPSMVEFGGLRGTACQKRASIYEETRTTDGLTDLKVCTQVQESDIPVVRSPLDLDRLPSQNDRLKRIGDQSATSEPTQENLSRTTANLLTLSLALALRPSTMDLVEPGLEKRPPARDAIDDVKLDETSYAFIGSRREDERLDTRESSSAKSASSGKGSVLTNATPSILSSLVDPNVAINGPGIALNLPPSVFLPPIDVVVAYKEQHLKDLDQRHLDQRKAAGPSYKYLPPALALANAVNGGGPATSTQVAPSVGCDAPHDIAALIRSSKVLTVAQIHTQSLRHSLNTSPAGKASISDMETSALVGTMAPALQGLKDINIQYIKPLDTLLTIYCRAGSSSSSVSLRGPVLEYETLATSGTIKSWVKRARTGSRKVEVASGLEVPSFKRVDLQDEAILTYVKTYTLSLVRGPILTKSSSLTAEPGGLGYWVSVLVSAMVGITNKAYPANDIVCATASAVKDGGLRIWTVASSFRFEEQHKHSRAVDPPMPPLLALFSRLLAFALVSGETLARGLVQQVLVSCGLTLKAYLAFNR
ncbi:hypothetical protein R3P38DRAFT_3497656 [Favolaschia claudopus]|uniref:Uncharacterized protein n=1 Tax=Favolaschia claudopus TaxID=2862362 RepID=A0AAV9Z3W2_9AGAR